MSFRRNELYIQEELLLLALKDDKGTFYMRTILPALGGCHCSGCNSTDDCSHDSNIELRRRVSRGNSLRVKVGNTDL